MLGILSDRRGATVGDVLVFLATLSIGAALLYPAWSVRDFRARVEAAVADVDAVEAAAQDVRENTGRWPTSANAGEAPPELGAVGSAFAREGYSVGWAVWEVVDSVEAPPPADPAAADDAPRQDAPPAMLPVVRSVGAITVHSTEADLLAELLERHSGRSSFVLDTMWMLVLPDRVAPPASFGFGR